jgi:hypothetical protein
MQLAELVVGRAEVMEGFRRPEAAAVRSWATLAVAGAGQCWSLSQAVPASGTEDAKAGPAICECHGGSWGLVPGPHGLLPRCPQLQQVMLLCCGPVCFIALPVAGRQPLSSGKGFRARESPSRLLLFQVQFNHTVKKPLSTLRQDATACPARNRPAGYELGPKTLPHRTAALPCPATCRSRARTAARAAS